MPSGLAHLRFSIFPVFGHRISCQDTGSIVAPREIKDGAEIIVHQGIPASLVAKMTPRSFLAVVT